MRPESRLRFAGTVAVDGSEIEVRVPASPSRIVSLVPSVTETLFALGLGDRVVGVTDWCVHPADGVATLPRVGGTKNPRIDAIAALAPDLVLANREENRAIDVERLRARGLAVWVDDPRTVDQAMAQIRRLASLGASQKAAELVLAPIEAAIARAREESSGAPATGGTRGSTEGAHAEVATAGYGARPLRGFVAVWKDPWMTLSRDTYAHDLLALAGIANLFADDQSRYPRVTLAEVAARDPEIVLLPDEPYRFEEADAAALAAGPLAATAAARGARIHVIDGTLPFWHGPRLGRALDALRALTRPARTDARES